MFSSKRSRVIAAGIAAIVIGGGSYGIVAATSSSATTTASSSTTSSGHGLAGGSGTGSGSNARSGPAAGGSVGTVSERVRVRLHADDRTGQKVTIKEASSTTYEKGTSPASSQCRHHRRTGSRAGDDRQHDHHGHPGHRGSAQQQRIVPRGADDRLHQGDAGFDREGRHDPVGLHPGVGDARQRHDRGQGDRSRAGRLPGRRRRPGRELGNGDYEVHNIGVNWPHHIFVNADFQVIGAND